MAEIPVAVEAELARLRTENARLLKLTPQEAAPMTVQGLWFDALLYVQAGRVLQAPVALEVSRSGVGAHA